MADFMFVFRNRRYLKFRKETESTNCLNSLFFHAVAPFMPKGFYHNPRQRFETVRRLGTQKEGLTA